jgi:hypothetical protein
MKYILLLGVTITFAFGSSAVSMETRNVMNVEANGSASGVEGVTIENDRAYVKQGYEFVTENRHSLSVIKTNRNLRLQTGSVNCTSSVKNTTCDAFISGGTNVAICKGTNSSCHFVGIRGGVRQGYRIARPDSPAIKIVLACRADTFTLNGECS